MQLHTRDSARLFGVDLNFSMPKRQPHGVLPPHTRSRVFGLPQHIVHACELNVLEAHTAYLYSNLIVICQQCLFHALPHRDKVRVAARPKFAHGHCDGFLPLVPQCIPQQVVGFYSLIECPFRSNHARIGAVEFMQHAVQKLVLFGRLVVTPNFHLKVIPRGISSGGVRASITTHGTPRARAPKTLDEAKRVKRVFARKPKAILGAHSLIALGVKDVCPHVTFADGTFVVNLHFCVSMQHYD